MPIRTSFFRYTSCKFIQTGSDNDKKNNYIKFDSSSKLKVYYIINKAKDQASNDKFYKLNKALNKI